MKTLFPSLFRTDAWLLAAAVAACVALPVAAQQPSDYAPYAAALAQAAAAQAKAAAAQGDAGAASAAADHVVVPLSHPSQPATVKVSLLSGSITVKSYGGKDVIVDAAYRDGRPRKARPVPPEAAGMHRLTASAGVNAEEDNNQVRISSGLMNGFTALQIQVPEKTSLELSTVNGGDITVSNVDGDISVNDTNGSLQLNHVSGSVVAHAINGKVTASLARLDANKPSSFTSLNGTIDVTLPADVKATLTMRDDQGDIYIDDGFNLQQTHTAPPASTSNNRDTSGRFRLQSNHTITGTINGGGAEVRLQNFNGAILVHRAK